MKKLIFILILLFAYPAHALMLIGSGVGSIGYVEPVFSDDFEDGTSSAWDNNTGVTVDTYSNLGITAPTGGGTYGAQIPSEKYLYKNITATDEVWILRWFRPGTSGTTSRICKIYGNGGATAQVFFTINTSGRVYIWNSATSTGYTLNNTYDELTWVRLKIYAKNSDTAGEYTVWYDAGAGWTEDGTWSVGDSKNNYNYDRVYIGYETSSQTTYADGVEIYDQDPGSSAPVPGVEAIIADNFETGDIKADWDYNHLGEVDTWANFGISGPTDSWGSYGLKLPSTGYLKRNIASQEHIWATLWFRPGSTGTITKVILLYGGASAQSNLQISTADKMYGWNYATSTGHTYAHTYTANAWVKLKIHVYNADSGGLVDVWYDDGSGWTVDGSWTGLDSRNNAAKIDTIFVGSSGSGQTCYFDEVNFYSEDPGSGM